MSIRKLKAVQKLMHLTAKLEQPAREEGPGGNGKTEPKAIPSLAALEEQDGVVEVEVNTTVPNTNDKNEAAEEPLPALAAEAEEEPEDGG